MTRNGLCSIVLFVFGAIIGCSARADVRGIVRIDGVTITDFDVRVASQMVPDSFEQLPPDARAQAIVTYLVESELLSKAAERAGLGNGDEFNVRMRLARMRILRDLYFERYVVPAVTESEIRNIYDAQIKARLPVEEVRVRHLLVGTEAEAQDLRRKIIEGATFSDVARRFSVDTSSNWNGGDVGYVSRGKLAPALEASAFSLANGDVSMPVQTADGWHLVAVEDRRVQPLPNLDEIRDLIGSLLLQRHLELMVSKLRAGSKIDILDKSIGDIPSVQQVPDKSAAAMPASAMPSTTTANHAEALARVKELPPVVIQWGLKGVGVYSGLVDGKPGAATKRAIKKFQTSLGAPETGFLTPEETVRLMWMAAENGQVESQVGLGTMLAFGIGEPKDEKAAAEWFRLAIKRNNNDARYNLALMLRDGRGVAADRNEAVRLLREASEGGHARASEALGKMSP